MTSDFPYSPGPGSIPAAGDGQPAQAGAGLLGSLGILVGSVLIGVAGGLIWAQLAPRALYVVVSHGSADVVNAETTAFIAGDAVYCMIGAAGGLIIGLAGYLLVVRRPGPRSPASLRSGFGRVRAVASMAAPMGAVLAGSVIAGIIARYIGEHSGVAAFDRQLLHSPLGTHVLAPLALAGDPLAATWPTRASLPDLAFWPLAACIVAGGLTLLVVLRERSAAARYPAPLSGPQQPFDYLPRQ